MNFRLIHIIILIAAGWILSSCQTEAPDELVALGAPIEFAPENETRALTTTITSNGSKFAIFADKKLKPANPTPAPIPFYDGVKVEYKYDSKTRRYAWISEATDYWYPDNEYSFVALYPYSLTEKTFFQNKKYENNTLSFRYSLPRDGDAVKKNDIDDILVAAYRRKIAPHTDGKLTSNEKKNVDLTFQHIMTVLNLEVMVSDTTLMYTGGDESLLDPEFHDQLIKNEFIQISKLVITGFRTEADIRITPVPLTSPGSPYEFTEEITATGDVSTITIEIKPEDSKHIVNSGSDINGQPVVFKTRVFDDKTDGIILIPQYLEDAKITVFYTVNGDEPKEGNVRYVTLPISGHELKSRKRYVAQFTIGKVYEGQIKPGSLKWIVEDLSDEDANDKWISEGGTIRQEFELEKEEDD